MSRVREIAKGIEQLTVADMVELSALLARSGIGLELSLLDTAGERAAPDPLSGFSVFDVELVSAGPNKLEVIKCIAILNGGDLASAKRLVDAAPCVIKAASSLEEAQATLVPLQVSGAVARLVGVAR